MGIGLSVCRTIIENHRGRLWAVSNDGPGVTFAFSLRCGPAQSLGRDGPSPIPELGAPETPTTRVS